MGIFLRGSPMVSVKKSTIFSTEFFSKIGVEIMLSYGLERKEAFDDDKYLNFFKSKKWVFSKRVHPWFGQKCGFFSSVFFSKIGLEIIFHYRLERKEAFEDEKNVNFFKSRKLVFSNGVNPWFGSKAIRPCCFLWLAAIYLVSNSQTLIPFNVTPMS